MNPVTLQLPPAARVLFSKLYRMPPKLHLTQGLLAITLPGERVLDVSWYPEFDPAGAYTVMVFNESPNRPEVEIETPDLDDVIRHVERLAAEYCKAIGVPVTAAGPIEPTLQPEGGTSRNGQRG